MIAALLLLQAAQPAQPAPVATPPDIQLDIRATARRVVIERDGRADLQLRASVNGRESEGLVEVEAPDVPEGRSELDNVEVRVRGEVRIPDPLAPSSQPSAEQEQAPPQ